MKAFVGFSLAVCALLAACGKQDSSSGSGSGNPVTAPVDYLGAINQAQKTAVRQIDLAGIKKAVELFHAQEDRYPSDLNELVQKRYLPAVPEPPPGSTLRYNPQTGDVQITRQ